MLGCALAHRSTVCGDDEWVLCRGGGHVRQFILMELTLEEIGG